MYLVFDPGLWERCLGRKADTMQLGKIRGGIQGISYLQIYLLIWKGSQILIGDRRKRERRSKIWALHQAEKGFEQQQAAEARPVHCATATVFTHSLSFLL